MHATAGPVLVSSLEQTWIPVGPYGVRRKPELQIALQNSLPFPGQTWTMTMIRLMLQAADLQVGQKVQELQEDRDLRDFFTRIAFLEATFPPDGISGAEIFSRKSPPRYAKTHLPFEMWRYQLEKRRKVKVIQTIRNPKDTLVSFYHHLSADLSLGGFNGTWDQFFEIVKAKKLPWGDFFEVNVDWYKFNKDRENSLVLTYEDMKKDHRGHVIKIAKFLGIDLSGESVEEITKLSSFKEFSPKLNTVMRGASHWRSERAQFVREGSVGGWRDYFSSEQSEWVDARTREILEPLGITFEYFE